MQSVRRVAAAVTLVLILVAPLSSQQEGEGGDTRGEYENRQAWFSRDKAYHFSISALGAAGIYALGREAGLGPWPSAIAASVIVGTAGFLREALAMDDPDDLLTREHFSRRDMLWNGAGIAVGISVTDRLLRDRWRKL